MDFNSIDDFQYVEGDDLSTIIIDNNIMPMRTEDNKNNLRGMDIAFGLEAVEERAIAINLDENTAFNTFHNKINTENLTTITNKLSAINEYTKSSDKEIKYNPNSAWPRNFIWNKESFKDSVYTAVVNNVSQNYLVNTVLPVVDLISEDNQLPVFNTDNSLERNKIETIYNLLDKSSYNITLPNIEQFSNNATWELFHVVNQDPNYPTTSLINSAESYLRQYYWNSFISQNKRPLFLCQHYRHTNATTTPYTYGYVVGGFQFTNDIKILGNALDINKEPYGEYQLDKFTPVEVMLHMSGVTTMIPIADTGNYYLRKVSFNYDSTTNEITIPQNEIKRVVDEIKANYVPFDFFKQDSHITNPTWRSYLLRVDAIWVAYKLNDRTMWD